MASTIDNPGDGAPARRRITRIELLVIIVIIGVLLGLILPAINAAREAHRRASCLENGHQLGICLQNYASTYASAFPPSAGLYGTSATKKVGGYSFLVKILPFMEYDYIYKGNTAGTAMPTATGEIQTGNANVQTAMNTSLKEFVCPSNRNHLFQQPNATPAPIGAFTNYKAMGATIPASLICCLTPGATVSDYSVQHPDGGLYPGLNNVPMSSFTDGLHTIMVCETMDDSASLWIYGNQCTLVGLPDSCKPTGKTGANGVKYPFYCWSSFDNTWGDNAGVTVNGHLKTYLMMDFSPSANPCDTYGPVTVGGFINPTYGPSSPHPAVAIMTYADGSVTAMSKRCDAANFFFLITKANNDCMNAP